MTITSFFELIASGATSVATAFVNLFTAIGPVFWTSGENGGPTMLTILLIAGVVLTLGFWAIDKLIGLAKLGLGGLSKARAKRSRRGA